MKKVEEEGSCQPISKVSTQGEGVELGLVLGRLWVWDETHAVARRLPAPSWAARTGTCLALAAVFS